jgi:hypothetical protein
MEAILTSESLVNLYATTYILRYILVDSFLQISVGIYFFTPFSRSGIVCLHYFGILVLGVTYSKLLKEEKSWNLVFPERHPKLNGAC